MQMALKMEANNSKKYEKQAQKTTSVKWVEALECQWRKFLKKLAVACGARAERKQERGRGRERESDTESARSVAKVAGKRVVEMLQAQRCGNNA